MGSWRIWLELQVEQKVLVEVREIWGVKRKGVRESGIYVGEMGIEFEMRLEQMVGVRESWGVQREGVGESGI